MSAEHLNSTVRDGSVNVGTIKYFDGVMLRIPEADKMANAWRHCNCCRTPCVSA